MERNYYTEKDRLERKNEMLKSLEPQTEVQPQNPVQGNYFDRFNAAADERQAQMKEYQDRYGLNLREEDYEKVERLNQLISVYDDPDQIDALKYRFAQALTYSRNLDMDFNEAYENLETLNRVTLGDIADKQPDKGNYQAVVDNFYMGNNTVKMGNIGFMAMLNSGNKEIYDNYLKQYRLLQEENDTLNDNVKRKWYVEALKLGAQTAPFSLRAIGTSLIPGVGPALTFGTSYINATGLEYMEMRDAGASHEVAKGIANVSGGIQALIEQTLGIVANNTSGVLRYIGGKAVPEGLKSKVIGEITNGLFKKWHYSGGLKVAANTLMRYGWDNIEEGVEEVLQGLVSISGQALAAHLEGYDLAGANPEDIFKQAVEDFKGGVIGSIVFGIPVTMLNARANVKDYMTIKNLADTVQSEKMFNDLVKDSTVFEGMNEEKKADTIKQIYEAAQSNRDENFTKRAEEIAELTQPAEGFEETVTDEEGNITNEAAYRDNGSLYTQDDIKESDDGIVTGTYKVGNPTNKGANLYGYINYKMDQENKTITIDDFVMSDAREDLRGEFFDKFAKDNAGYSIEWNPIGERAQTLKENLIKANPNGKNNGLSYYTDENTRADIETRKSVAKQIKQAMPNLSSAQITTDVALLESVYKSLKKDNGYTSFTDYINKTFGDKIFGDTQVVLDSAQTDNKGTVRGGVSFNRTENSLRAVIYATENADFSTWNHEVAHIFRQQLQGDLLEKAEKAFGVVDGNWTTQNEEAFAEGFEQFLRTGKAKNSALKELFTKLAEFMARVYGALKNNVKINPQIEEVYNELVKSGDSSVLALAEKAVMENDNEIRKEEQAYREQQKAEAQKVQEQENFEQSETNYVENTEDQTVEEETQEEKEFKEEVKNAELIDKDGNIVPGKVEDLLAKIKQNEDDMTLKDQEQRRNSIMESLSDLGKEKAEELTDKIINGDTLTSKEQSILEAAGLERDGTVMLFQLMNTEVVQRIAEDNIRKYIETNMSLAEQMEQKYKSMDPKRRAYEIKKKTGCEKINGEWKYEYDDSGIGIRNNTLLYSFSAQKESFLKEMSENKDMRLGNFVDAAELYSMFPGLKNVKLEFINSQATRVGMVYNQKADSIIINANYLDKPQTTKMIFVAAIQRYLQSLDNDLDYSSLSEIDEAYTETFKNVSLGKLTNTPAAVNIDMLNAVTRNYLDNMFNMEVKAVAARLAMNDKAKKHNLITDSKLDENKIYYQSQKDDVREMYEGTDKWLKAPNGQDTNLTEDQWLTVRTPNFKNWFGDWEKDPQNASKVTDNNGEPRVVFHGTYNGDFDVFDRSKASTESDMGAGFYFTSNEDDVERNYEGGGPDFENKVDRLAERIADEEEIDYDEAKEKAREQLYVDSNLYDVFLDMKYPCYTNETDIVEGLNENLGLDIDDYENEDDYYDELYAAQEDTLAEIKDAITSTGWYGAEDAAEKVMEFFSNGNGTLQDLKDFINDGTVEVEDDIGNYANNEIVRIVADTLGYDGIIDSSVSDKFKNMNLDEDTTHFIMFNNTSIKSATDNNGEFSRENPSILYQTVDLTNELIDVNNKVITAQTIENHLNKLIGQVFDTATSPLKIKITKNNKPHIISTNVKLKGAQEKRHNAALSIIEKIINNATMTGKPEDVDLSHNTNKKTLAHKQNVLKYITFVTPAIFNTDLYDIELTTERVKGQKPSLLDLYNVKVKSKGPIATNLIALQQGLTALNNTTNDSNVNTQLDLFQNGNTSYDNTMDSPQFKAWFGDWQNDPENSSKVVDENGKPLIVYHGTEHSGFDTFNFDDGNLSFFTPNKAQAVSYAGTEDNAEYTLKNEDDYGKRGIYAVYLNIRNMKIVDFHGLDHAGFDQEGNSVLDTFTNEEAYKARDEGYDGILIKNVWNDIGPYYHDYHGSALNDEYIVFDPKNIKSATDNNGQFDPNNPSMLFQPAFHGSAANFDKFNVDEYGLSGEGSMSFGYGTYVSASEDIARDYAERQRPDVEETVTYKGKKVEPGYLKALWIHLNQYDFDIKATSDYIKEDIEWAKSKPSYPNDFYLEYVAEREAELNELAKSDFNVKDFTTDRPLTNLYTVDIPDSGFIKWDEDVDPKLAKTVKDAVFNKLTTEPNEDGDFEYKGVEKELQRELNDVFDNEMTGQQLYNNVAVYVGGERNASKLLNSLGIPGIDYPAGTNFGTPDGKTARNFVIFNDEDAKIVDHILFQTMEQLYDDARNFDNWQEFMEYYESFGKPEVSLVPEDADAQWYQTTWEMARNIKPESYENEELVKSELKSDQDSDDAPQAKDALFVTKLERPGVLEDFLKRVYEISNMDIDMYADAVTEEDAAERDNLAEMQDYIKTQLRHGSWLSNAGRVINNKPLTSKARSQLLSLIRSNARDYRDIYSTIMEDSEFKVADNDKVANKIYRLADPEIDVERKSPEERRRIADKLENEAIAKKIKDGTMPMDDELDKYLTYLDGQIKEAEKETRKANEKLKELGMEVQGDYQRISDWQTRRLLELHDQMLLAKTKLTNHSNEVARRLDRGIALTGKYEQTAQNLKANYDTLFRKFDDLRKSIEINEQIKAALNQREQVAEIKDKVKDKENEKKLVEKLKKMRIQLVKRTMRRVPFTKINYDQARTLIAIQRALEPNLLGGVNKWIGQDSAYLRGVISQWITDADAREKIKESLTRKGTEAAYGVLEKLNETKTIEDFNNWTAKERQRAHRVLPKENWIRELNLEALADEREKSIQLDISETTETKEYTDRDGKKQWLTLTRVNLSEELTNTIREALGDKLYNQVMAVPFSEWTTEEMEDLAKRVDEIYIEGRNLLAAKQQAKKEVADEIRKKIAEAVKNTGIVINDDDDDETKKAKQEKINKILGKDKSLKGTLEGTEKGLFKKFKRLMGSYFDANVLRVSRILDNNNEGVNFTELYRKEDYCFNNKARSVQARNERIEQIMRDNNITAEELMDFVEVGEHEYTVDELLFFKAANTDFEEDPKRKLAQNDPYRLSVNDDYAATSRNAVMFGNMLSSQDDIEFKEQCRAEDEAMEKRIANGDLDADEKNALQLNMLVKKPGTLKYLNACKTRFEQVLQAADKLDKKYDALLDAINEDYSDQYDRMNKASIEIFNIPVNRVKSYVPLVRLESNGDTNENRVREDLLGAMGVGKQWVDKGMTKNRVNIGPLNQKPVETGLYKTWTDSVERTEHFIAYSPYVQELNSVYKSRDSQYLRGYIENRYGKGMLQYIDNYINEVANPNQNGAKSGLDQIVRMLRGKTAPAYLAWKASGVIKQALTSPGPYLQFVSAKDYLKAYFECIASKGKLYEDIKSMSVFMNSRVFDPMIDLVNELAEKKTDPLMAGLNKFEKIGMQGLEWIDWVSVAPGWLACYRNKIAELEKANEVKYQNSVAELTAMNDQLDIVSPDRLTNEQIKAQAINSQLDEGEIQRLAVEYADDCTRACQPSSRTVDLAPLFKQNGPNSEVGKALLQFTTSLNVIWQNIRYDIPYAVKQQQFQQIVGMIIGYVLAGVFMNAVTDTPDDDDTASDRVRKLIWYSTTQFTDAIPVLGQLVTNQTESLITGKKGYQTANDIMPTLTKFVKGLESARDGKWHKAAQNVAEGIGMGMGLPVSGAKELLWSVGIGDGDGELEFKPDAFIGRRRKD